MSSSSQMVLAVAALLWLLMLSGCQTMSTGPSDLKNLAKQGDTAAQYNLGVMHAGKHTSQDDKMAVKYFREVAEQGHADAQYNLGFMYHNGKGLEQDYQEAARWV